MPRKIARVQNSRLRFDPRNARLHPDRNKQVIRQSLEEVGPFRSIAVDGDDIVRAGNGVLEQAQGLGIKVKVIDAKPDELIAVRRKDLRGKLAERAAILDNRAGELAEWDPQVIAELAQSNPSALEGLWSERELNDLFSALLDGEREEKVSDAALLERANELQRKWKVQRGDVWQVPSVTTRGKIHRIMCGDALVSNDLAQLLNGTPAALCFTSPPYWDDIRGVARQYGHPASFPLELARRHILLYTKAGEAVIDIFLGAGTTIAAAEMLGRVGYGMEIDPKYAAVTLERLANLGLKPQRAKASAVRRTARRPHERRETP